MKGYIIFQSEMLLLLSTLVSVYTTKQRINLAVITYDSVHGYFMTYCNNNNKKIAWYCAFYL